MSQKPKIFKTAIDSYGFFFKNFLHALYLCWPLAASFVGIIAIIAGLAFGTNIDIMDYFNFQSNNAASFLLPASLIIFAILAITYFFSFCAIGWHRTILLGKDKSNFANPFKPKRQEVQFWGKTIWLYILGLLISIPVIFIASTTLVPALSAVASTFESVVAFIVVGILGALAIYTLISALLARFMLYFPAKAAHDYIGFKESFKAFKGLTWRFILTVIVAYIPYVAVTVTYQATYEFIAKLMFKDDVIDHSMHSIVAFFNTWIYGLADVVASSIMMPFIVIYVLCMFYKWRKENPIVIEQSPAQSPSLDDKIVEEEKAKKVD